MTLLWIPAVLAGLLLAILASRQALDAAVELAHRLGMSPFIIGMTVVAFGTDLPEIANSITASATDHGDINVGDSIGSVVTQITLILGILCLFGTVRADRSLVAVTGVATVFAVLLGAVVMSDGFLARTDGLLLLAMWVIGAIIVQRAGHIPSARQGALFSRTALVESRDLLVGLAGVALGAILVVTGFTELAEAAGVPEYALSFVALSLGTSLPELFIDGGALRRGEAQLALGGVMGASFVDATISLGIGPTLFPVAVSDSASWGSLIAAAIVAATILLLLVREEHRRRSAFVLFVLYATAYSVIVV